MASIGHVVVGLAAARLSRYGQATIWSPFSAAVVWSGLSLLPDADVLGFRLASTMKIPGAIAAQRTRWCSRSRSPARFSSSRKAARFPPLRTALIALAVVSSHALLDTLTDGGLGCALLWPFSDERFFAPWAPLPVAPIGRAFLSAEGLRVALVELVALSPLIAFLLWHLVARNAAKKKRERPDGPPPPG